MAGLINTQIKTNNDANSFVGYDPEKIDVDRKSTVQGQVADIISSGSPLHPLARTSAKNAMNRRGLVNSAMGVGAGEKAVMENAIPIATQDANTYFNAQLSNQKAGNDARQFTADATNKAADIVARTVAEKDINNQRYVQDVGIQTLRGNQEKELQTMRGEQQEKSDNTAAATSRVNTASQSASLIYAQTQTAINAILADPDTTPEIKQQRIDAQRQWADSVVGMISKFSDIDLSDLLGTQPTFNAGTTNTSATTNNANTNTGLATEQSPDFAQMAADLASINKSSANEQEALTKMIAYGKQKGATLEQMAAATGRTLEQAQQRLALYNLTYP